MKKIIKNNLLMLKYIVRFCPNHIFFVILNSIFISGISIVNILIIRFVINSLTESSEYLNILLWILIFMVFNICYSLFSSWLQEKAIPKNTQILSLKMQMLIFEKTTELDLADYEDADFYNKFTFALHQSDARALAVLNTFSTFIGSLFGIASLATLITSLEPIILLFVVFNVFVSFFINARTVKIRHDYYTEKIPFQRESEYTQRVFYLRDYAKELRLFPEMPEVIRTNFKNAVDKLLRLVTRYGRILFGFRGAQGVLGNIVNSATMIFLTLKVFFKELNVADFIALSNSSQQLSYQINQFIDVFPQMYEHSIYIEKFVEFIEYKAKIGDISSTSNSGNLVTNESAVTFDNVSFAYPGTERRVLKNINIRINSGEKVAFVGRNGAGKTTLIKLITRLYDPSKGNILLNGTDFRSYNVRSLRQNVGIVFQDYQPFAVTIAENILMRPIINYEDDEALVISALKFVNLYEKVRSLSNGIYTVITREFDEEGVVFSGGELQKIAIARIYAQKCNIVILDEPSSALDTFSENEIFKSILEYAFNKTVILISHRLANVKDADKIFYIEDGSVLEVGRHEELIGLNGKYADMFEMQANRYHKTLKQR